MIHNPGEIRPKLSHDAVILPAREGVLCKRGNTAFRLTGRSIARWISILIPSMTGEYTLEALCTGLEPAQRETVSHLVEALLQRGILVNALPEAPGLLPEAVRAAFRTQIEFINHFADRPQERFHAFRESRVLVIGSGIAFTSLAIALVRNGLKKLFLAPGKERQEILREIEPEVELLGKRGSEIFLSTIDLTSQSTASRLRNYDVIVYCSEHESLKEVFDLNRRCLSEGRPFLPAVTFAGRALIGPFVRSVGGPCWLCAQMRLAANMDEGQNAALWRTMLLGEMPRGQERIATLNPLAARRIGHGSGFELFKLLSGALPSEAENGVIFQGLVNLETSHSTLAQHPLCPHCSQLARPDSSTARQLQEIVTEKRESQVTSEELLQRFSPLIDLRLGLFSGFSDGDIRQLPLKGTKLVAGSPVSGCPVELSAYSSESVLDARVLALRRAIKKYAQELAEAQNPLFASYHELRERGKAAIVPSHLRTWSGKFADSSQIRLAWLPAFSVLTQEFSSVPAAAVYPYSQFNHLELFRETGAGLAVGTTFRETLAAGLRTALAHQALQKLARGEAILRTIVDEALSSDDADLTFLLRSLRSFERTFALREIQHSLPVAVVLAFTTDQAARQVFSVGTGFSDAEAVKEALLDLAGRLQHLDGAGELFQTEAELFPDLPLLATLTPSQEEIRSLKEPGRTFEQIEDCLRARGEEVLFVNTTSPDLLETKTFLAGTILLAKRAQEERV